VSIAGAEPGLRHEVVFFELETSLVGTPTPISGRSFALCTITADTVGRGTCSGHLEALPEPAEIVVFLASQEGSLLQGARANGDFTFVPMELPGTGTGFPMKPLTHARGAGVFAAVFLAALTGAIGIHLGQWMTDR
jgi:hypothetical protein